MIKEIISLIYILHSKGKVTDSGLKEFNNNLIEVYVNEKEEERG